MTTRNVTANTFGRKPGFPSRRVGGRVPARRAATDVVDDIMEFLSPGKLYDLEEVAKAVGLPETEVERILDTLMQINFVEKGVRITNLGRDFLKLPVERRK